MSQVKDTHGNCVSFPNAKTPTVFLPAKHLSKWKLVPAFVVIIFLTFFYICRQAFWNCSTFCDLKLAQISGEFGPTSWSLAAKLERFSRLAGKHKDLHHKGLLLILRVQMFVLWLLPRGNFDKVFLPLIMNSMHIVWYLGNRSQGPVQKKMKLIWAKSSRNNRSKSDWSTTGNWTVLLAVALSCDSQGLRREHHASQQL